MDKDAETITTAFNPVPVQCLQPSNTFLGHNSFVRSNPHNSSSVYRAGNKIQTQPIELVFDASGSSTGDCTEEYLQKMNNLVLEKWGASGRYYDLNAVLC